MLNCSMARPAPFFHSVFHLNAESTDAQLLLCGAVAFSVRFGVTLMICILFIWLHLLPSPVHETLG